MSDASRMSLSYGNEVTYGTAPGGQPRELRYTGESLKAAIGTARSAEVKGDRMTADILRIANQPAGNIQAELSYLSHGDLIAAALWSAAATTSVTLTNTIFAINSGAGTLTRSSGSFVSDGFVAGSWIRVSGFANAGNNSVFKVTTVAALTLTLAVMGSTLVTESAGATVTIKQSFDRIGGTTQNSLTIEKNFADNTNDYELLTGCLVNTWGLVIPVQGIITHDFGIVAQDIVSAGASAFSGALLTSTNPPIPAVTGVFKFCENGTAFSACAFSMQLNNNLRPRNVIGTYGPASYGSGTQDISGTLEAYYTDEALIDKAINATTLTASSLSIVFNDTLGNYVILDIPAIKFTGAERLGTGRDGDVLARMEWQAYRHSDGTQIRVANIAA